jgi:hypothetical protein
MSKRPTNQLGQAIGSKVEGPPFEGKVDQASVHYRRGTEDRRCGNCTMFREMDRCTYVEGNISRYFLCDAFSRVY